MCRIVSKYILQSSKKYDIVLGFEFQKKRLNRVKRTQTYLNPMNDEDATLSFMNRACQNSIIISLTTNSVCRSGGFGKLSWKLRTNCESPMTSDHYNYGILILVCYHTVSVSLSANPKDLKYNTTLGYYIKHVIVCF